MPLRQVGWPVKGTLSPTKPIFMEECPDRFRWADSAVLDELADQRRHRHPSGCSFLLEELMLIHRQLNRQSLARQGQPPQCACTYVVMLSYARMSFNSTEGQGFDG